MAKLNSILVLVIVLFAAGAAKAQATPVANWTLDEYEQAGYYVTIPESINSIDGSTMAYGGPPNFEEVGGMVDGAFLFNEESSFTVGTSSLLNFGTDNFSISFWFHPNDLGNQVLLRKTTNFLFDIKDGDLRVQFGIGGNYSTPDALYMGDGSLLQANDWQLIVFTVDRSDPNGGQFYIDGYPVNTDTVFQSTTYSANLSGLTVVPSDFGGYSLNSYQGRMDDLFIYEGAFQNAAELLPMYEGYEGACCIDGQCSMGMNVYECHVINDGYWGPGATSCSSIGGSYCIFGYTVLPDRK